MAIVESQLSNADQQTSQEDEIQAIRKVLEEHFRLAQERLDRVIAAEDALQNVRPGGSPKSNFISGPQRARTRDRDSVQQVLESFDAGQYLEAERYFGHLATEITCTQFTAGIGVYVCLEAHKTQALSLAEQLRAWRLG